MFRLISNEVFKIFANKKIYVFMVVLFVFSLLPALELALGTTDLTFTGQNLPLTMLATINSIIPIFVIITLGDLITDEYINGTLKLSLLHPVSRGKLLTAKFLALIIPLAFLLLMGMIISYLVGTILFGWGESLVIENIHLSTGTGILTTIGAFLSSLLPLMSFAAVIMFLCFNFASSGAAVAASISFLLLLSVVGQLSTSIRPYLIITYFAEFPRSILVLGDLDSMLHSLLIIFIYMGAFYFGSLYIFKKKDLLF